MSKQRKLLPQVIRHILGEFPGCGIILHGSVQRGYERESSDIDLFVITAEGETITWDLDKQIDGISIEICFHPAAWFKREFLKQPYLYGGIAFGEVIADPAGLAATHQTMAKDYFNAHAEVSTLWQQQLEAYRRVKLGSTAEDHDQWDQFANFLREQAKHSQEIVQPWNAEYFGSVPAPKYNHK